MIKIGNNTYKAEKGKFIIRKSDNTIMGKDICLGSADDISNYKEKKYTKKAYREFYESIGININIQKAKKK